MNFRKLEKRYSENDFNPVSDPKFLNGGYCVRRSKEFYDAYYDYITNKIKTNHPGISFQPMTYGWFRTLDDGNYKEYEQATRLLCICRKCYREWDQPYFAINCNHTDTACK